MFGMFKKKQKSDLEKIIEKDGIEYAAKRFTEIVMQKITTVEIAYQFILEEIEAASRGNVIAMDFARNSGISSDEYKGSMSRSCLEVDGPDGPQQTLLAICMQLIGNQDLMVKLRIMINDNIMKEYSFGKYRDQKISSMKGCIKLQKSEANILFIVRDNIVIYINEDVDFLFEKDKDGDEKLNGRVVNFVFSGQLRGVVTEIFVAFDDSDSYAMFALQSRTVEQLNYVAQAVFEYLAENSIKNVFLPAEKYAVQYIYTFKLYRKNDKYFMINNSQTQAYLIDDSGIFRDDVDAIKCAFWE